MAEVTSESIPQIGNLKIFATTITITEHIPTPPLTLVESIEPLKAELSSTASIHFPNTEDYISSTKRWSTYRAPKSSTVVNVASEADIAATVCPFLNTLVISCSRSTDQMGKIDFNSLPRPIWWSRFYTHTCQPPV